MHFRFSQFVFVAGGDHLLARSPGGGPRDADHPDKVKRPSIRGAPQP
jgi:hypothetical protein